MHFNFRIGADDPEVAVECKFEHKAYTSVSGCLMSLTWAIKQIAVGRVGTPILGERVLGPCPCAGQISWLVAVYEYPGRVRQQRLDHVLAQAKKGL